jgi:alkylhydroperoxidase family enzyme
MRLDKPRVPPVPSDEWTDEQREIIAPFLRGGVGGKPANVFGTLLNYPKLMKRWLVFANHCLAKSSLPARDRELVILRTAWLARCDYEWAQHVVIGERDGVTADEMDALKDANVSHVWGRREQAIITATDELAVDVFLSDLTWASLENHLNQEQIIDLIFLVGQYRGLAGALNSLGVQLDDGLKGF